VRGPAGPRPRQLEEVSRAWWSSVDVLGQNDSTDLGHGRPLLGDAGRGSSRPIVGLDGPEKTTAQEGTRLIHAWS
jgi:hypothetical protein